MGLFGLLLLSFGAFGIVCCSKCVPETAKCSQYWVKIEPHKDLMETESALDSWCKKQTVFYGCLEEVLLEGKNGNLSYLPTNLLISKLFAQDLCSESSTSRRRLLQNAACINQLNTEYCTLPEFLDIVNPDDDDAVPPNTCSVSDKTFSCIAATMVLNCGFDAARVYRTMLKITRYSEEVCDIETPRVKPPCETRKKLPRRDPKLSEVYYGLVHRIGSIPEQENEQTEPSVVLYEQSASADVDVDEVVTEAIQTALESLDRNVMSDEYNVHESSDSVPLSHSTVSSKKVGKQYKPYMKNPIITDIFKGLLFYNYSSLEYALYWRQPDFLMIERLDCQHLRPSYLKVVIFRCKAEYRGYDPDCISNATVHEKVTPALIRDLDPEVPDDSITEFGPRPAWMKDLDDAYEEKRIRDQLKSTTPKSAEVTDALTTSSTLLHVAATITKTPKSRKWWEWDRKRTSAFLPDDLFQELMDLFMPEPEKFVPAPMNFFQVGNTTFTFIYDPLLTNAIENFTCSRLDECHPRGRGLWKCGMWRRKVETCDLCYEGTGANILGLPVTYASPAKDRRKQSESQFQVLETTDPSAVPEGSGMPTDATPEESITLVFSGDVKSEVERHAVNHPVSDREIDVQPKEVDESSPVNDAPLYSTEEEDQLSELETEESEVEELEYRLVNDEDFVHDLRVLILDSIPESDSNSEHTTELVYAVDDTPLEGGDEESEEISSDDETPLFNGNVLVLQGVHDSDNIGDYAIIATAGDAEDTYS